MKKLILIALFTAASSQAETFVYGDSTLAPGYEQGSFNQQVEQVAGTTPIPDSACNGLSLRQCAGSLILSNCPSGQHWSVAGTGIAHCEQDAPPAPDPVVTIPSSSDPVQILADTSTGQVLLIDQTGALVGTTTSPMAMPTSAVVPQVETTIVDNGTSSPVCGMACENTSPTLKPQIQPTTPPSISVPTVIPVAFTNDSGQISWLMGNPVGDGPGTIGTTDTAFGINSYAFGVVTPENAALWMK